MSTSLNRFFQAVALAQGVEIGSNAYRAAGPPPFSGQTGGHSSYGWRHDYKLKEGFPKALAYTRAAIANYCSRPSYYEDAPNRHSGYWKAGRPFGWTPESSSDLADGRQAYITSKGLVMVSGPDVQHFWLDPLWAIIDEGDDALTFIHPDTGDEYPAHWMARIAAQYHVKSLAGMIRQYYKYTHGGRATARIIDTFVQAGKRNLVDEQDAALLLRWLDEQALPQLERAPGVNEVKGSGYCNWYQECGWMMLPLYELSQTMELIDDPEYIGDRAEAIRYRIGGWMLEIDEIGGHAAKWEQLRITTEMRAGDSGAALSTLGGHITKDDLRGQYSYSLWSVTAADIARLDHPSDEADAFFERVKAAAFADAAGDPGKKVWLVDRNRDWLVTP